MRNILFTIQFDGTNYHGFQVQQDVPTVQAEFQRAIVKTLGKRYDIKGCSRTDSGVHADGYRISMLTDTPIPNEKIIRILNYNLPWDIAVKQAVNVPEDFHARYSATGKEYTYRIFNSGKKDVFNYRYAYQYYPHIDEELLHQEAQLFVGTHDFSSFCTKTSLVEDPVRTIRRIDVVRNGKEVLITVEGDGFLHNMVRIIVGTLIGVNKGKIEQGEIVQILENKCRRHKGVTAPAKGLCLTQVYYPNLVEGN